MEEQINPSEGQEQQAPSFSFVDDANLSEVVDSQQAQEPEALQQGAPEEVQQEPEFDAQISEEYIDAPEEGNQQEYSQEDVEGAVANYLSERLGIEVNNLDDLFEAQQESDVDERISAIAEFVAETGRSPQDWFIYQQLNPSEMDDMTAIQVQMASDYPNLSQEEVSTLMSSKYKIDPNLHSEEEVNLSQLQMKIDAQNARQGIEELRSRYSAPEVQESEEFESPFDDQWYSSMEAETQALDGVEFDLGNGKSFTFGLNDRYRSELMEKNTRLDEYFDPYVQQDGAWDYDKLNVHRAVVDNMEQIVQSVYQQGMADGQRGIVSQAANVQTQAPNQGGPTQEDSLTAQLKQAMGGSSTWSF